MKDLELLKVNLRPFKSLEKIRLGSKYDGGYVMPIKALKDADCLISFGVSTNFDFEKDVATKNSDCKIYMFDPFIGIFEDFFRLIKRVLKISKPIIRNLELPHNPEYSEKEKSLLVQSLGRIKHWNLFHKFIKSPNITYFKLGLRDYEDSKFLNFKKLFSEDYIKNKKSIILKIDIEGDEYKVFRDLIIHVDKVTTILLEVHDVELNVQEINEMIKIFQDNSFLLTHIHGNNSDLLVKNTSIPNTLELTFNRLDYCEEEALLDNTEYPISNIDYPCNPRLLDYSLEFLRA